MKTLYIMRHSQAVDIANSDFERELTQQGIENTKKISSRLKELDITVDLVLASPATRTKQTAQLILDDLNCNKDIAFNEAIYNAYLNELTEIISYTYDTIDALFLVGHNPSLGLLAYNFVNFTDGFKKSMVMKIEFNCNSWMDIDKSNSKLCWVEKLAKS